MANDDDKRSANVDAFRAMFEATPQAHAEYTLPDIFPFPKIKPTIGEWYFSAKCEHCRGISPAIHDLSGGLKGNPFIGQGGLRFDCHFCDEEITVLADDILPLQWQG